ncbi:MAG: hypothetical protein AB7P03_17005 [Kofleriaceae bacterium]
MRAIRDRLIALAPRWRAIRAGLIALAITIAMIDGCPIPPPDETLAWQEWYATPIRRARNRLLRPFRWISRDLRLSQRWALFQSVTPDRFRLTVEGRLPVAGASSGEWSRVFYRAGDPALDDYEALLEYRRVRGAWNPSGKPPAQYLKFARWFAVKVLEDHPELDAARLRFERVRLSPGQVSGLGEFVFELGVRRDAM